MTAEQETTKRIMKLQAIAVSSNLNAEDAALVQWAADKITDLDEALKDYEEDRNSITWAEATS